MLNNETATTIQDIQVSGNYVYVQERGNREYGNLISERAFKMRNYGTGGFRDVSVDSNTFIAATRAGYMEEAVGGSVYFNGDNTDVVFSNNLFKGLVLGRPIRGAVIPRGDSRSTGATRRKISGSWATPSSPTASASSWARATPVRGRPRLRGGVQGQRVPPLVRRRAAEFRLLPVRLLDLPHQRREHHQSHLPGRCHECDHLDRDRDEIGQLRLGVGGVRDGQLGHPIGGATVLLKDSSGNVLYSGASMPRVSRSSTSNRSATGDHDLRADRRGAQHAGRLGERICRPRRGYLAHVRPEQDNRDEPLTRVPF